MKYYYFTYRFVPGKEEKKRDITASEILIDMLKPSSSWLSTTEGFGCAAVVTEGEFFIDYWREKINMMKSVICVITWFTEISKEQYDRQGVEETKT